MGRREPGPTPGPPGLPDEWPVPWQPVVGSRDGLLPRVQTALVSGALGLAARMPESWLDGTIAGLARVAYAVDARHREAGRRFLRQALGDLPEPELARRTRQAYRHFFRVLTEPRRFLSRVAPERTLDHYDIEWTEDARAVMASGGCVLVTGHIGDWEAGVGALPWLGVSPVYAIAKPPRNRPLSILVQREREKRGVRLLPRKGAMRDAPKVLRAGGAIGMLLDQRARQRPILAPFFGRPARCDRTAGVLLKRLRAPVLICACYRAEEPLRYRLVFQECLWPDELAGAEPVEIATRLNRALEALILANPDQYFWIHDRYRNTPETLPPVAGAVAASRETP